jgi:hypothetical protein
MLMGQILNPLKVSNVTKHWNDFRDMIAISLSMRGKNVVEMQEQNQKASVMTCVCVWVRACVRATIWIFPVT